MRVIGPTVRGYCFFLASSPFKADSVLRVMNRDPPICAHHPRSSDSKSSSDGGNGGGPGGAAGICGFRILDIQNLPVGEDGMDLGPGTGFSSRFMFS